MEFSWLNFLLENRAAFEAELLKLSDASSEFL